jgi:aryl-alcohol dehydrogenase-like predicted oxidoreductase
MKYNIFGRTGLKVSRIALGGFPFSGVNKAAGWDPYSSEGRATAIETINTALDLGINYIDTAPAYGDGHSENIIGEALATRRKECYLATKVSWTGDKASVLKSVEDSLKRLRTDYVDVIQFHGSFFTPENFRHIMEEGPYEALELLVKQGKARWIGVTAEEPWTALDFVKTDRFDVVQICYNMIYQSAALHLLNETSERNLGVTVMRPMTSGILQRILEYIGPELLKAENMYELCLKFVLSDTRVHMANVGMRWPDEIRKNVKFVDEFSPVYDMSKLPRLTAAIYKTDDERAQQE